LLARRALECAGVEFIDENGCGSGVVNANRRRNRVGHRFRCAGGGRGGSGLLR